MFEVSYLEETLSGQNHHFYFTSLICFQNVHKIRMRFNFIPVFCHFVM